MAKLPTVLLSCSTFKSIFEENGFDQIFEEKIYLDSGLHVVPKKLHESVQSAVDQIQQPSLIVLGYGLCGNGLRGVQAGPHTLLIPRADDCITLLMGSRKRYLDAKHENAGTYFMTKGWLDSDATPLAEYNKTTAKYGQQKADRIMDLQYRNYSRLMFVAHRQEDFATYQPKVQPVAEYCSRWGMRYEEYLGSLDFIRLLIESVEPAALGEVESTPELIVVHPGEEIKMEEFLAGL